MKLKFILFLITVTVIREDKPDNIWFAIILKFGEPIELNISNERLRRRKRAFDSLDDFKENPDHVLIIHYSCESFYNRPNGSSPRITSIATRNWGSGQTYSFSIHQQAERDQKSIDELETGYDVFEKKMLSEFYQFAEKHDRYFWIHWNMRDINYGFPALEHRAKVLDVTPFMIPEEKRVDLARLIIDLFGVNYIGHPRSTKLMEKNRITHPAFLTGQEEADAFNAKEYVKLHQSTLRKVDVFSNILGRVIDGSLKTNAKWKEIYGGYFPWFTEFVRTHWIFSLIGFIAAALAIGQIVWRSML